MKISSIDKRKKAIFETMSKKRQKRILDKITYEKWNPFEEPKDPIDIRTDKTNRTYSTLLREFLKSENAKNIDRSSAYDRGLLEMIIGLSNNDDRFIAIYNFSLWYDALLKEEGLKL